MIMDVRDLELKLCTKEPIFVDGVPIYPITLADIAQVGYIKFNTGLRLLCLTEDEVRHLVSGEVDGMDVFTFLIANALQSQELMDELTFWLSQITHSKIIFSKRRMCFTCGAFDITKDNFNGIQAVIRHRNGLQDIEEEMENPANEAARRVLQRRKEERLKRKHASSKEPDSEITLSDLVSILASGLKMTMDKVMEYDLYQFNDQFNRLRIMDDYEISVQALLHGAKKEDVKLTHWITKIKHDLND